MKKVILVAAIISGCLTAHAQDFVDNALLFSRVRPGGSARIQALGGAQVSLGGDFSSALSNPAGLGMYNRSEFTFSAATTFQNVSSDYLSVTTKDSKSGINIPGLSLVYHHDTGKEKGFLGGSFAVTLSRINDFNYNFNYKGTNNQNSIVDYFIGDAYGKDPSTMLIDKNGNGGDNFFSLTGLAYNNYLIEDYQNAGGTYAYRSVLSPLPAEPDKGIPAEVRTEDQEEINNAKGAQYQWSLSYGANFSDKLFVGAGIGITSIKFKVRQIFKESNFHYSEDPSYVPVDNFQTREDYNIRGQGINLNLGAIYRPVNFLQIGASLVTPSYYAFVDNYSARIDSKWNIYNVKDNPSYPDQSNVYEHFDDQPVVSQYSLHTPMRFTTGATFITKYGFITGDVELVNYSKARYSSTNNSGDFGPENQSIKADYQPYATVNYRLGAEFRAKIFRARAGYNFMPNPYRNSSVDQSIQSFSGGVGIRKDTFFADLTAVYSNTNRSRSPYFVDGDDPVALQKFKAMNYILTVGFTF
jgi:hypothetical protein